MSATSAGDHSAGVVVAMRRRAASRSGSSASPVSRTMTSRPAAASAFAVAAPAGPAPTTTYGPGSVMGAPPRAPPSERRGVLAPTPGCEVPLDDADRVSNAGQRQAGDDRERPLQAAEVPAAGGAPRRPLATPTDRLRATKRRSARMFAAGPSPLITDTLLRPAQKHRLQK